jgi:uncharacterized membrane protein
MKSSKTRKISGGRRKDILVMIFSFILLNTIFVGLVNNIPFYPEMNAVAEMGGPDLYGYRWYDSNAPSPTIGYSWVEINTTGIDSGIVGDDSFGMVPIGFDFKFYGNTYNQVNVTTNGLIMFTGGSGAWGNGPIPNTANPDNMLVLFWDDLYDGGGTIFYETMGISPNREFVVQYENWWTLGGTGPMKFQAILYETGDIKFQYDDLGSATSGGASVGIENIDGTDGLQYSYNNAVRITSNLAIMFSTSPPPYLVSMTIDENMQFNSPGQTADHTITINNVGTSDDTYDLSNQGTWPVTFRDIGDTIDITNIFVSSNTSENFIARVTIPGGSTSGDYDLTDITGMSQGDSSINDTIQILTGVPLEDPWFDDFEFGVFGGSLGINWSTTESIYSDVGTQTSNSGFYSMFVNGGIVNVTSYGINTSDLSELQVSFWIQKGDNAFSEPPDSGEDLQIYYRNDIGNWILLDTLTGGGVSGEVFKLKYMLSADALHESFQLRFRLTGGDGIGVDFWHIDDVYIGEPIPYEFELTPGDLEEYDSPGSIVDYIYSINNTGRNNDTYNLSFADNTWSIKFRDIGDTTDLSNISINSGNETSFIVRVVIPGGALPGEFDFANITVTSEANPILFETVQIKTGIPISVPWFEDFEFGTLGGSNGINWSTSDSNRAGVNDFTSQSGIYSMYSYGGYVTITSWYVDTSALSNVQLIYWVRKGSDDFSEFPDLGENLNVYYYNDTGSWILLDTFYGGGSPGEIFKERYSLPADASHVNFRLRFEQTDGSTGTFDFWHIDDIVIREQPAYDVEVSPPSYVDFGTAGASLEYTFTIYNWGSNDDTIDLSSVSSWPVTIRNALDTQDITDVYLASGNSVNIIVRIGVPGGAIAGDSNFAQIIGQSQNDTAVNSTSHIETYIPITPFWVDDMESGAGNWEVWDDGDGTLWELGNPSSWPWGPTNSYSPTNCWGTNIGANYTASGDATLALPYMDLSSYSNARFSFYHWYDINGNWNDGGWVEVTTDSGSSWTRIAPIGGYPDVDFTGWSCYAGSSNGWLLAEFDLSGYYGTVIQIRFHFYDYTLDSQERAGWYIDDVTLTLSSGGSTATATGPLGGPSGDGSITITYTTTGDPSSVDLYYTKDSSAPYSWTFIGSDFSVDGSYPWVIPSDGSYGWYARTTEELAPAPSDAPEASYYIYDVNPPEIAQTQPQDASTDVYINQFIIIKFNEPMDNTSLTFTCSPDPGGWSISWNENNDEATLIHANFAFTTAYTFQVTGATDLVGNSLVSGTTPNPWTFTTEATDSRPPSVFSESPFGFDVAIDDNIIIVFNETMNTASVESSFSYSDGTSTWSISSGSVSWNSPTNNRMTFNPTADFDYLQAYTITLNSDTAQDVNGNTLDGNKNGISEGAPQDDHTWSFTTMPAPDLIPPVSEVGTLDPYMDSLTFNIQWTATDATGIQYVELYYTTNGGATWTKYGNFYYTSPISFSVSGEGEYGFYIVATDNSTNFNREAEPSAGTLPDKSTLVDTIAPSVSIGDNVNANSQTTLMPTVSDSGSGISNYTWILQSGPSSGTVTWGSQYALNTTISADIEGTYVLRLIVTDLAGNLAFDEINLVWDQTAPTAAGSPDWDGVSIFADVIVTFSERVDKESAESAFSISPSVSGIFYWSSQDTEMTFDPSSWFNSNTVYTITVDSDNVFDLAGNGMQSDVTWSFTTGSQVTNNIIGKVENGIGKGIPGATVRLEGTNFVTTTDENGEYIISDVPVGNYTMVVEKNGYKDQILEANVDPYQPTVVPSIALEKKDEESSPLWIILAIVIIIIVVLLLIILMGKQKKKEPAAYESYQQMPGQYTPPPSGEQMPPYGVPPQEQPPYETPPSEYPPQDIPPSDESQTDIPPSEPTSKEVPPSEDSPSVTQPSEAETSELPSSEQPQVVPLIRQEGTQPKEDVIACINCKQPITRDIAICPNCSWDQTKPLPPPPPGNM